MIQLNIMGRLGNQMFQYAYARTLQEETGQQLCINWKNVVNFKTQEKGFVNSLQDFHVAEFTDEMQLQLTWQQKIVDLFFEKVVLRGHRDVWGMHQREVRWAWLLNAVGLYYMRSGYYKFQKAKTDQIILSGNFESPKYFEKMQSKLREEFTPIHEPLAHNEGLYKEIEKTQSICVTIRRGDYYTNEKNKRFQICTSEYYVQGVEHILKQYPDAQVFAFSDDIEWVKENIKFPCKVSYERGDDPVWEKLRLMYSCKHFVISNSTFSWWAQYLGSYKDKIVVAPDVWVDDGIELDELKKMRKDIYEDHWVQIHV